jgi:RHS repeat-associated protein
MQTTYNQPNVSLTYVNGGLDRYARIINHSWIKNTNPLVHIIHSYDYNGNRIKRYDPIHAANSELYTYDNLGQIKTLNRGVLNTAQNTVTTVNHSESWNFDKTGNWSQYTKNSVTKNRDHNAANELQGIANHDANGNMVLMPGLKGKYDAWNRLVEVRDSNDNLIAQYEYNGLNQRLKKTVGSTVTKSFFNENWQEIESVTNNQVTSYVWGLRYIDDLVLREKGEERLYSLADPNWNVIAICDSTGSVVERMKYDAFGKITRLNNNFGTKNGSDYAWNRTFTGQVFDLETELMLYRNRYYHTGLGRFTTIDPIKYEAGDENLYRYCENIPVQSWDSYGYSRNGKRNKAPSVHCSLDPCVKVCNGNRLPGQLDKTACIEKCFQMEAAFQDWYERNRDITWTKNLEPCPCNLKDRCKNKDKWTEPTTELHGYHVGATSCIRSSTGIWKSENQCCYDENGNLITSGSGQGSADRWRGPSITFPGHVVYDMEPADWATLLDGGRWGCHSEAYLNVRPQVKPDDCEGVPTPVQ